MCNHAVASPLPDVAAVDERGREHVVLVLVVTTARTGTVCTNVSLGVIVGISPQHRSTPGRDLSDAVGVEPRR